MPVKQPAIYIMANKRNGTIYTGVTSDLIKRVYEHKYADVAGFTQKQGCKYLVYYELIEDMMSAIDREKQLKGGSRKKKLALIEKVNPYWDDLYEKASVIISIVKATRLLRRYAPRNDGFKNRTVQRNNLVIFFINTSLTFTLKLE